MKIATRSLVIQISSEAPRDLFQFYILLKALSLRLSLCLRYEEKNQYKKNCGELCDNKKRIPKVIQRLPHTFIWVRNNIRLMQRVINTNSIFCIDKLFFLAETNSYSLFHRSKAMFHFLHHKEKKIAKLLIQIQNWTDKKT